MNDEVIQYEYQILMGWYDARHTKYDMIDDNNAHAHSHYRITNTNAAKHTNTNMIAPPDNSSSAIEGAEPAMQQNGSVEKIQKLGR